MVGGYAMTPVSDHSSVTLPDPHAWRRKIKHSLDAPLQETSSKTSAALQAFAKVVQFLGLTRQRKGVGKAIRIPKLDLLGELTRVERKFPSFDLVVGFLVRMWPHLADLPRLADDPRTASVFRGAINDIMCRFVASLLEADCVYMRVLLTDGTTELLGDPFWASNEPVDAEPPPKIGAGLGHSACLLEKDNPIPHLIGNTDKNSDYQAALTELRQEYSRRDHPKVCNFLSRVKADACIPLVVYKRPCAGIVAVRWKPYSKTQAEEKEKILVAYQKYLSEFYFAGLQLATRQRFQVAIQQSVAETSKLSEVVEPKGLFQSAIQVLVNPEIFGWQRVGVFVFDDLYPCDARGMVSLIRGTARKTLPARVPETHLKMDEALHYLFCGYPKLTRSKDGVVILEPTLAWVKNFPGGLFAHAEWECPHFLVPLVRPEPPGLPFGFVILDDPQPYALERSRVLGPTRHFCDLLAGHLMVRGFHREGWAEKLDLATPYTLVPNPLSDQERSDLQTRVERVFVRVD